MPEWIGLPSSVAVPFGSLEATLEQEANQGVAAALPGDDSGAPTTLRLQEAR